MPNEQKIIRPSTARKREPRKQVLDSTPIKRSGDGTMNFMVWSLAGTVLAACGGPIFGKGTDITGGGGGGDSSSGPSDRGYANDGPARDAHFFIDRDSSGTYTAGDTDLGVTNDAGYVELDSLPEGTVVLVDANGAVDTATGKTLSGIWRSLPYNGSGDLLVSPLTNLLALRLEDTPGIEVGGEDAFYQEILNSIWGAESGVTVSDILDPDNYNPLVEDNIATQLVSRVAIGLTEIGAPTNAADSAGTLTEIQALFATYRTNIGDDNDTNDDVVLSGNHADDVNSLAADAESRPVVVDPNEGDSISIREGEDFVLMPANGNPVSLFGFEDPLGNDDADGDGAREPGQIVGIYIESASADGNITVRFGDTTSSVALDDSGSLSAAERGVPSDGTISADGITTIGGVTFYYVSAENFARLVLRPTNNDFNTASVDDDNLPQIRFYVYDGEDVTVDAGGSLDRVGALAIEVANVNDAPVQANAGSLSVAEGGTETITDTLLEFTDVDNAVAELIYTITDAPMHGILQVRGDTIASGGTFTQADIDAGDVQYEHDDSENHADGFTYSVSDGEDTVTGSFSITISPVNDNDPVIRPASVTDLAINAVPGNLVGGIRMFESDDVDAGDTTTWSIASRPNNEGTYGRFEVDSNTGLGTFTFLGGGASESAFDAIASGSSVVLTYMVTATDGSGGTHEVGFNIVLQGQDDAPVFDDLSEFTGNVVNSNGATGTITVSDIDGDTIVLSAPTNTDYGTLAFSRVGSTDEYEWTLNLNPAGMNALDALGDGETSPTPIAFAITATGGTGGLAAMQTLMITLQGTNDAPTITSTGSNQTPFVDASATDHIGSASAPQMFTGTAVASDVDANDGDGANGANDFTWSIDDAPATAFGTLVFDNGGVGGGWTFTTNAAAFNALTNGQRQTITYSVQSRDPQNALSAAMDLTITLEGVNDKPELAVNVVDGAVTEAGDDGDTAANGSLTITDPDTGHDAFAFDGNTLQGRSGSTGNFTDAATDASPAVIEGVYGTLTLRTDGTWTYALRDDDPDTQALRGAAGSTPAEMMTDVFEIQLVNEDGTGQGSMQTSDTVRITIDVTGANDDPVIRPSSVTNLAINTFPNNGMATQTFESDDVDTGDTTTWSVASRPNNEGTYGRFEVDSNTGLGTFTFLGGGAGKTAFDAIAGSMGVTLTYMVRVTDGSDGTHEVGFDIVLQGQDSAPMIGAFTNPAEITNPNRGQGVGNYEASGTFMVTDADDPSGTGTYVWNDDTPSSVSNNAADTRANYQFEIMADGSWTFDLTPAGLEFYDGLDETEQAVFSFDITVHADGAAGNPSAARQLNITFRGVDDAPVFDDLSEFTGNVVDSNGGTGRITVSDIDGDTIVLSAPTNTDYGTLAFSRVGSTDEYEWTLNLNPAGMNALDALGDGQTSPTPIAFAITATGGTGGLAAMQTLMITLQGTNDAPSDIATTPVTLNAEYATTIPDSGIFITTLSTDDVDASDTHTYTIGGIDGEYFSIRDGSGAGALPSLRGTHLWIDRDAPSLVAGETWDITITSTDSASPPATSSKTFSITRQTSVPPAPMNIGGDTIGTIEDTDAGDHANIPASTSGVITATGVGITWSSSDIALNNFPNDLTSIPVAEFGSLTLTPSDDGTSVSWEFTPTTAAINALRTADTNVTITYTITARNAGGMDTTTLTINLDGVDNDVPEIVAGNQFDTRMITDMLDVSTNEPDAISGAFTATGTVTGWTPGTPSFTPPQGIPANTDFGTLTISDNGEWRFEPTAAINMLTGSQSVDLVYSVIARNAAGDSTPQAFTITLQGRDNVDPVAMPVIDDAISVIMGDITDTDAGDHANIPASASGMITATGVGITWSSSDIALNNFPSDLTDIPVADFVDMLTLTPSDDGTSVTWEFTPTAAINALRAADTGVTITYTITARNGGGTDITTLMINLDGVDNAEPEIVAGNQFDTRMITDMLDVSTNEPDAISGAFTATGTVTGWTPGTPSFTPPPGIPANTDFGTLTISDNGEWRFEPTAAINMLTGSQSVDLVYSVIARNAAGDSTPQAFTITLQGRDNVDPVAMPMIDDTNSVIMGDITDTDAGDHANIPASASGVITATGVGITWSSSDIALNNFPSDLTDIPVADFVDMLTLTPSDDGTSVTWEFTPTAAINALRTADTNVTITYTITARNGGGTDITTLMINLDGVDNAEPEIVAGNRFDTRMITDMLDVSTNEPDAIEGTIANSGAFTATGTVTGWSYTIADFTGDVPAGRTAADFGTLTISDNGEWRFEPTAAINMLTGSQSVDLVYSVIARNDAGDSTPQAFTITLQGRDNVDPVAMPMIDDAISVIMGDITDTDAGDHANIPASASGVITATGTGITWSSSDIALNNFPSDLTDIPVADFVDMLTLTPSDDGTSVTWEFTPTAAINALRAADTGVTITYTITARNGGGTDITTLMINLDGVDNAEPEIVAGNQFDTRMITDMLDVSTNEPDAISGAFTATGTVTGWTPGIPSFTPPPGILANTDFGTLMISDNGEWRFEPTAAINMLTGSQSVDLVYSVIARNAAGDSIPQTFTITLQGRDNVDSNPITVTNEGGRAFVIINGVEFRASDDGATGAPNGLLINFASGGPGVVQEAGFQGRAGSYSIRAGNDFSRANIAGIWNTDSDSNDDATATIIETGAEPGGRAAWQTSIAGALRTFSTGTDAPDLSVKEGTDLTASGWLQVTGGTGDITYGSTMTGTNTPAITDDYIDTRKYTYAGTYGDLVIDGDGDWVYTLGGVASSANAAAYQIAIDELTDTAPERFNLQINIGEQSITHDLEITVNSALGVSSEGVREHLLIYGVEFRALVDGARGAGGSIYFNNSGADDVAVMASSYAITTSIFSQANIANLWNTDTNSNGEITTQGYVATIIEEMSGINMFAEWIAMERGGAEVTDTNNGRRAFTAGTDAADLEVSEDTDLTASGWLQVTGGTGDITYGNGSTMTGTNTPAITNDHIDTRKYTYAGIYGNLVIDGDGDWVYTLGGSDIQNDNLAGLISTAPGTDEFRVEISRGAERVPQTITITVNGTDAAPMLAEEANADKTATEAGHALSNAMTVVAQGTVASGGLTHTDDDAGQEDFAGATVQIKADTEPDSAYAAGQGSNTGNNIGGTDRGTAVVGTYGIIYLRADGDWYYELADMNTAPEFAAMRAAVDALDAGDPVLDRFVVRVQDTADAALFSNLVPITIAITGTNDRPEIDTGASTTTYDSVNSRFVENVTAVPDDLLVSGMLVATDPDADDANFTWDYQAPANLATYGTFNIVDGNWTFTLGDGTGPNVDGRGAFGMISENNPVNLDFTITATDAQGAVSVSETLRLTLEGNNRPVAGGENTGTVREAGHRIDNGMTVVDAGTPTASGSITHTDSNTAQGGAPVDDAFVGGVVQIANIVDVAGVSAVGDIGAYKDGSSTAGLNTKDGTDRGAMLAGDYGTIYLRADGDWYYELDNNNAAVRELEAGSAALTERFSVRIQDGSVATLYSEPVPITITIDGTDDAPRITRNDVHTILYDEAGIPGGVLGATDDDKTDRDGFTWVVNAVNGHNYGVLRIDPNPSLGVFTNWTFTLNQEAFDALPGGAAGRVDAVFSITAQGQDNLVSDPVTVTIQLHGVNEFQTGVSGAFEADYDGNGDVPRDLKVADLVTEDVDVGETFRYLITDSSLDKDSFAIRNGDELWILEGAPGRAQGDTWDVKILSISNDNGSFFRQDVRVRRVGDTIDPPDLTILSDGGFTVIEDGYQDNGLTSIIGSFSHTDADIGEGDFRGLRNIEIRTQNDSLSYDFNTGDPGPNQEIQLHGDYGRLIIAVGGNLITEWSYILGDSPELNALDGARAATDDMPARAADMVVEQFLVRVEDRRSGENGGESLQASDTFMITIRGTNDSPVIDIRTSTTHYDNSNARFEAIVDAITSIVDPTVMGRFIATDLDAEDGDDDDDFTWAGTQVADTPEELTTEQGYGMLSLDDVGNWDFTFNEVGAAAFSNLRMGEQINLDFMITATDRQGAPSEARILRITLNGQRTTSNANNPTLATPAISLFVVEDSTTMRFIVDEMLGFGDTEDADADLIIVASLEPAGLDVPAAPAATSELLHLSSNSRQRIEGTYGNFILTRDNDTGQIKWTYVINDERKATNALSHYRDGATDEVNANALGTEMLSLRVWDSGGGASDIRAISVQIRGANDKPEISQVSITNTPSDNTQDDMDNPSIIPVEPNPSGVINFLTIDAQSVVDSIIAGNPITGTFSASDPDAGASQTWSAKNTLPDLGSGLDFSSYGSFVVNPAGEWTFSMEAFQASQYARLSPRLPSNDPDGQAPLGQYVYDFTIRVTDADSATGIGPAEAMTDEQIFRITFVGAEDAPQTPTFNDSSNNQLITTASAPDASGDRSVSGSLVVREPDQTGSIDWSSSVLVDSPVYAGIERLGTLSFVDTGQDDIVVFLPPSTSIFLLHETARWTFTLSEDDFRSYGTTQETLIFDIIATDDTGLSSEALQLTIMVQGEEDPYTISPDSLSAIINEKMTTGQIEAIEHDIDDLINGAFNFEVIDAANPHGTFSITDAATGAWEFTFNEASMDALTLLREGAQLRPFTVSVRVIQTIDGVSSPAITENLRLTIQGTNDVPTLTALDGTMAITADITESTGDNVTANAMTGGMLMNVDPDAGQSAFDFTGNTLQAAHGISTSNTFRDRQIDGTYGTLRLNNVTGAWTYELDDSNDSAADRLAGGATQTDTFTIRMENVDGPSTVISNEVTLTINITGANDAPKIDNNTFAAQEIRAHPADGFIEGTFSAADRDMGDSLTWSVLGRDAVEANFGTFEFTDAATGAWRFTFNPAAFGSASSRGTGISTRIQVRDREQVNDALTDEQVFLLTLFGGGGVPIIDVGSNTDFDNPDNESDTGNQHVITALFGNANVRVIGDVNTIGDANDSNDVLDGRFTATDADDSNFTWTASNPRVEGVSVQDSSFILDFLTIENRPTDGIFRNGTWSYNFGDTDGDIIKLFDSLAGAHSRGGSISKPAGEVTLIFDITAEDDNDNISPTQELKITLRGVNDNPSLDGIEENPAVSIRQGVLTSTIFEGGTYEITGNFRATDPDVERITYSVSSNGDDSRPNGIRDENNRIIGTLQDYGDIDFGVPSDLSHSNPNVWRFVLNGHGIRTLNALGANEEVSTVYGVAATDGINATGSSIGDQGIKITLRGAGSDPLPDDSDPFTGFVTDPDAINSNDDPTTRPGSGGERIPVLLTEASGTFSLTNIFAWRASNANTATSGGPTVAEKNGWSTLTFDHQLINHNGWTFALTEAGERALANLAPGETEVLRYRISLFDSFDGEADQNYTYEVTLRGHAVPELSEPGQALYHVVEGSAPTVSINNRLTFRDAGDSNSALVIVASLNQADIDVDTAPASNRIFGIQTLNGVYGDFRLLRNNRDGAIEWTYTLDNNRAEPLGSNDTPEEMFYIRVWDPNNSSSEIRTINVQVQGVTRQVPVLDAPPADASYHVVEDNDPEPDTISAKLGFSDAETSSANLIIAASTGDLNGVPAPSADQTMVAGTYGDFTVERSIFFGVDEITWTYTIDEARTSALLEYREDSGEAVAGTFATETLYLRVWDNNDQRSSAIQTISIQVRGANDAPTDIHATPDGATQAVADNAVVADYDNIRTPSQPLLIAVLDTTDDDTGDAHTYTISAVDGSQGAAGDAASFEIRGTNNDELWLIADDTIGTGKAPGETWSITITATDSSGAIHEDTFTIIHVTDVLPPMIDNPNLTGSLRDRLSNDHTNLPETTELTGMFTSSGNRITWTVMGDPEISGSNLRGLMPDHFGALSFDDPMNSGAWTFTPTAGINSLHNNHVAVVTYRVAATSRDTGFVSNATLEITFTGTNDAPILSSHGTPDFGVTEDDPSDTAGGRIITEDPDIGQAITPTGNPFLPGIRPGVGFAGNQIRGYGADGNRVSGRDTENGGKGTQIEGIYGYLYLKNDGTWTYELDDNFDATDNLTPDDSDDSASGGTDNRATDHFQIDVANRDIGRDGFSERLDIIIRITGAGAGLQEGLQIVNDETAPSSEGYYHVLATGGLKGTIIARDPHTGMYNFTGEDQTLTNYRVALTEAGLSSGSPTTIADDIGSITAAGTFAIGDDGIWTYTINEILTDTSIFTDGTTTRSFWVAADEAGSNPQTVVRQVSVTLNQMDLVRLPGDSITGGATNQLIIGSGSADGSGASPLNTAGGTDIIIGLEGDDGFRLGRNHSDTIYHRFSSSGTDWANTDGSDTVVNYIRIKAGQVVDTDTFIFVDTDTDSAVSEDSFLASDNIRFYANFGPRGSNTVINGFEIRFVNPTNINTVESTITFQYHTSFRPDVTQANDRPAFFGTTQINVSAGTREITDHSVWGHYFGDHNPDAFQVVDDDDLPSVIMAEIM